MILLPKPIIKLAVKDLIRYDGLKTELVIINNIMDEKDSTILNRNNVIGQNNKIIVSLNKELKDSQEMFKIQQKITESVEVSLKKQKQTTYIVGGVGVIIGILIKVLFI